MQRKFIPNPYRIEGECAIISLLDSQDEITGEAIIDLADLDRVLQHRWGLQRTRVFYARTSIARRTVYLHRFLLDAQPGHLVDHRNHNGMDNRRANLRECSVSLNSFHRRGADRDSYSGVRNVTWDNTNATWNVMFVFQGKRHWVGRFKEIAEAEQAAIAARARMADVAA